MPSASRLDKLQLHVLQVAAIDLLECTRGDEAVDLVLSVVLAIRIDRSAALCGEAIRRASRASRAYRRANAFFHFWRPRQMSRSTHHIVHTETLMRGSAIAILGFAAITAGAFAQNEVT